MLNKLCNLNALLLALAPVLSVYSLAGLTMSFFVIWVVAGLNILAARRSLFNRRLELSFFLCILVLGFLSFLLNSGQGFYSTELYVNNLFAIVSFFIALVFCTSNVNINLFKKTVCFVGVIAACICIFQRLQFIATGSYLNNFFIAGLEVKRDLDMFSYGRPSAFFTEPAHLAIYLLPVLYLTLVEKKRLLSFVIGIGILVCGSTTGFLLLFVAFLFSLIREGKSIKSIIFGGMLITALYGAVTYLSPDILLSNMEKLQSTESDGSRLLGPLNYFKYYDFSQYLFGIGINQMAAFLRSHGFVLVNAFNEEMDMNYANALIYMVLCYGLIGGVVFVNYLTKTFKQYNCKVNAGYFVILLGILFSDQVLFNMNFLYPLSFVILLSKNETICVNEKTNSIV